MVHHLLDTDFVGHVNFDNKGLVLGIRGVFAALFCRISSTLFVHVGKGNTLNTRLGKRKGCIFANASCRLS